MEEQIFSLAHPSHAIAGRRSIGALPSGAGVPIINQIPLRKPRVAI
jgi:hypothetical protein